MAIPLSKVIEMIIKAIYCQLSFCVLILFIHNHHYLIINCEVPFIDNSHLPPLMHTTQVHNVIVI